ncbi:MAG: holo-ACP synthase [Firmicutes bacterium]|nr:holo-ACP synthase [Bacillota bacterium]
MERVVIPQIRTGVDIIEIERIARAYQRRPQIFMKRFFTAKEQKQLALRQHVVQHLAVRFAAKEAVFKLLGLGLGRLAWTEVEVLSLSSGEPSVCLHGKAALRATELSLQPISLSMSHSRKYAVAQAVAFFLTNS